MKLRFIFALLIALIFGSTVRAIDGVIDESSANAALSNTELPGEVNTSDMPAGTSDLSMSPSMGTNGLSAEDTATTMAWPAIPGESLNDIARLFYPKNKIMRQQFVTETLALNNELEPKLNASKSFAEPTLLQIPTLKSLSKKVSVIKAKRAKVKRQKMQLSYNINQAASKLPAFLLQEYEALLAKNAFLKAELERLHARIGVLQEKFNNLKLVFDRTMRLPADPASTDTGAVANNTLANTGASELKTPQTPVTINTVPVKKVFKNLNQVPTAAATVVEQPATKPAAQPALDRWKYGLLVLLGLMIALSVAAYFVRKRRQRMLDEMSNNMPAMDDTLTDFGGQWQDTEQELSTDFVVEQEQSASASGFLNTEMRDEQAKATSTLEEARLLMSINRAQDAIAHLKLTIEAQPKVSINHWLYLLEIFRKQNAKDEFEKYAKSMHITFNVLTPVWYESNAAIVVSQYLEDFPHIMEKLDAVWPSELARVYLESLITDNRDGERAGFSQSVLDEILLLIGLLDARKELE